MVAHISTVTFEGVRVLPVDVQVQVSGGLPTFTIVGLPDKAVGESVVEPLAALVGAVASCQAHHGEFIARRHGERRQPFRFADCDGAAFRYGRAAAGCHQ